MEPILNAPIVGEQGAQGEPGLPETVRAELTRALNEADTQLGLVFQGMQANESNKQMIENKRSANHGALANNRTIIKAIFGEGYPDGPSISRQVLSSVRQLERNNPWFSTETKEWLAPIKEQLQSNIDNPDSQALSEEATEMEKVSGSLEEELATLGGIYVYSYPHYIQYPKDPISQRTLYKVGMSVRDPKKRVLQQVKGTTGTSTPEDPVIVRVYTCSDATVVDSSDSPKTMEDKFHKLLHSAGHTRESTIVTNREWFLTDLDFLDTIAEVLGYRVV